MFVPQVINNIIFQINKIIIWKLRNALIAKLILYYIYADFKDESININYFYETCRSDHCEKCIDAVS